MSIIHLTEDQIQLYLDRGNSKENALIEEHLQCCEKCSYQLEAYKLVFAELAVEPEDFFSTGFESVIIDKIQHKANRSLRIRNFFLYSVATILGIIISLYVFLSVQISENMLQIIVGKWIGAKYLYDYVFHMGGDLNISLKVLASAGIVLFFYGLFDRILLHSRSKKLSVFWC